MNHIISHISAGLKKRRCFYELLNITDFSIEIQLYTERLIKHLSFSFFHVFYFNMFYLKCHRYVLRIFSKYSFYLRYFFYRKPYMFVIAFVLSFKFYTQKIQLCTYCVKCFVRLPFLFLSITLSVCLPFSLQRYLWTICPCCLLYS